MSFFEIQTRTGWGRALQSFAEWCRPEPGWLTLDVGCGPGLLPALFAQRGCRALGVELDRGSLAQRLHPTLVQATAMYLPFRSEAFHLVTASNLLFFLPDPEHALCEMARLARADGWVSLLNPSEKMSVAAATALTEQRGLSGLDRDSLIDWAMRAEVHPRWSEADLVSLFAGAGLILHETALKIGPGLARFARARRS